MLSHAQKLFITRIVLTQWALEEYPQLSDDYEPDEQLVIDTVAEFDADDSDGYWEEIELMWNNKIEEYDNKVGRTTLM